MIAGLPLGTWVLMTLAVVPGIVLVTLAYRVHRRGDRGGGGGAEGGPSPQAGPGEHGRSG